MVGDPKDPHDTVVCYQLRGHQEARFFTAVCGEKMRENTDKVKHGGTGRWKDEKKPLAHKGNFGSRAMTQRSCPQFWGIFRPVRVMPEGAWSDPAAEHTMGRVWHRSLTQHAFLWDFSFRNADLIQNSNWYKDLDVEGNIFLVWSWGS